MLGKALERARTKAKLCEPEASIGEDPATPSEHITTPDNRRALEAELVQRQRGRLARLGQSLGRLRHANMGPSIRAIPEDGTWGPCKSLLAETGCGIASKFAKGGVWGRGA